MLGRLLICFRLTEDGHSHFVARVTLYITAWYAVAMSMRSALLGKIYYKISISLKQAVAVAVFIATTAATATDPAEYVQFG